MLVDTRTGEIIDTRPLGNAMRQKRHYKSRYSKRRELDALWILTGCALIGALNAVIGFSVMFGHLG